MIIKLKTYAGEQVFAVQDIRVFYNKDCGKYGVEAYGNLWNDCMGDRWQQVTVDGNKVYTKYKGVAARWLKKIIVRE